MKENQKIKISSRRYLWGLLEDLILIFSCYAKLIVLQFQDFYWRNQWLDKAVIEQSNSPLMTQCELNLIWEALLINNLIILGRVVF